MKISIFFFFVCTIMFNACTGSDEQQKRNNENGMIIRIDSFISEVVNPRDISVWVPADYDSSKRYAVIYVQSGQMLFDSTATWNKKEWQLDETMTRLSKEGTIRDAIIVGIANDATNSPGNYFPDAILTDFDASSDVMTDTSGIEATGDEYLLFVVHELKPYIDSAFLTKPDMANTFIMGASLGGVISLYALCEYPRIFGGAACISTHWPLKLNTPDAAHDLDERFLQYLDLNLPSPQDHKVYFDLGTETLDSTYMSHQLIIDSIMTRHGYTSQNWMTKVYEGDEHSETSWSKRVHVPLEFLLSP